MDPANAGVLEDVPSLLAGCHPRLGSDDGMEEVWTLAVPYMRNAIDKQHPLRRRIEVPHVPRSCGSLRWRGPHNGELPRAQFPLRRPYGVVRENLCTFFGHPPNEPMTGVRRGGHACFQRV